MADLQLQEHVTLLGHEKAPGVFLAADGPRIVSPPEAVMLMVEMVAINTGQPDLAAELRAAFEKSKAARAVQVFEAEPE